MCALLNNYIYFNRRRHIFKLYGEAPIAYHLEMFSNTKFVLTDEDSMFNWLSQVTEAFCYCVLFYINTCFYLQDCCRLVKFSSRIINHFLRSSKYFGDAQILEENLREMAELFVEAKLNSNHIKVSYIRSITFKF